MNEEKEQLIKKHNNIGKVIEELFENNMEDLEVWGVDRIDYELKQLNNGKYKHIYKVQFIGCEDQFENPFHLIDMEVETISKF